MQLNPGARSSTVAPPAASALIKSVTTAAAVLDCFTDDAELGVSDIARQVGVAKSTSHRLLTSLRSRGLVERTPEGRYRLGIRLYELGQLAQARLELHRLAMPLLEQLRRTTQSVVHLAIPGGVDVLFVERLESPRTRSLLTGVPRRLPAHASASGQAIAAYDDDLAARRRDAGFPALTPATIRDAAGWEASLQKVRRRGVAAAFGQVRPGLLSVAAPVLDPTGRAVAAISLVGPDAGAGPDLEQRARLVVAAGHALSRRLER